MRISCRESIFCICHMPNKKMTAIIARDNCRKWFHKECQRVSTEDTIYTKGSSRRVQHPRSSLSPFLLWIYIYIHVKNPRQTFFCITLSNFPCYHSPFHHWMRNHCQILEKIVDENTDYHFCRVLHNYTVATLGGEQDKQT